jgi:hypothetical protein
VFWLFSYVILVSALHKNYTFVCHVDCTAITLEGNVHKRGRLTFHQMPKGPTKIHTFSELKRLESEQSLLRLKLREISTWQLELDSLANHERDIENLSMYLLISG